MLKEVVQAEIRFYNEIYGSLNAIRADVVAALMEQTLTTLKAQVDECDKKCEHLKEYTYQEIQRAYDEAIGSLTSRPRICPACGRGCFNFSKFCSHCGKELKK